MISEKQFEKEIGNIQVYRMVDQAMMVEYLQSASIAYLTDTDYKEIAGKLNPEAIKKQLETVKERLTGANSVFIGSYFAKDPLNALGNKMSAAIQKNLNCG